MKILYKIIILSLVLSACTKSEDSKGELSLPKIEIYTPVDDKTGGIIGDTIFIKGKLSHPDGLGKNLNLDIHNDFDAHSHGTDGDEGRRMHHKREWNEDTEYPIYITKSFPIPENVKEYEFELKVPVPSTIKNLKGNVVKTAYGYYHLALDCVSKSGYSNQVVISFELKNE